METRELKCVLGLHLIVKIQQASDGSLTGTLNSVDQNVVLPLETVSFATGTLRFEQKDNGVVYRLLRGSNSLAGLRNARASRSLQRSARSGPQKYDKPLRSKLEKSNAVTGEQGA